ncbi:hypothetical protein BZA77DRAFT_390269 [Pyronema omphalodes]|nr:hypothetical protein BZA77DRAFT_390269 [Pyronema omphalodes]
MPAKAPVDENVRFLYSCLIRSDYHCIDFHRVANDFGINPAAARMRWSRLRKNIAINSNFKNDPNIPGGYVAQTEKKKRKNDGSSGSAVKKGKMKSDGQDDDDNGLLPDNWIKREMKAEDVGYAGDFGIGAFPDAAVYGNYDMMSHGVPLGVAYDGQVGLGGSIEGAGIGTGQGLLNDMNNRGNTMQLELLDPRLFATSIMPNESCSTEQGQLSSPLAPMTTSTADATGYQNHRVHQQQQTPPTYPVDRVQNLIPVAPHLNGNSNGSAVSSSTADSRTINPNAVPDYQLTLTSGHEKTPPKRKDAGVNNSIGGALSSANKVVGTENETCRMDKEGASAAPTADMFAGPRSIDKASESNVAYDDTLNNAKKVSSETILRNSAVKPPATSGTAHSLFQNGTGKDDTVCNDGESIAADLSGRLLRSARKSKKSQSGERVKSVQGQDGSVEAGLAELEVMTGDEQEEEEYDAEDSDGSWMDE